MNYHISFRDATLFRRIATWPTTTAAYYARYWLDGHDDAHRFSARRALARLPAASSISRAIAPLDESTIFPANRAARGSERHFQELFLVMSAPNAHCAARHTIREAEISRQADFASSLFAISRRHE